jgi:hypothetical protein
MALVSKRSRLRKYRAGRLIALIFGFLILSVIALAAKQFAMPAAQPGKTYPAHDEHADEAVTVALDPYDTADKAGIFSVQYNQIGMLPIFVVVTNDGDQPVSLIDMKAQLVTGDRIKLSPALPDDIERRLSHPTASTNRYPLPFPTKKVKGGVGAAAREEIENARFGAKAVEPHSTQSGFLFFDVRGISAPLEGAHFYLTGVRNAQGNELMYFEVSLEKYLNGAPKP